MNSFLVSSCTSIGPSHWNYSFAAFRDTKAHLFNPGDSYPCTGAFFWSAGSSYKQIGISGLSTIDQVAGVGDNCLPSTHACSSCDPISHPNPRLRVVATTEVIHEGGSMKTEINVHSKIRALAFLPDEPHCIVSGEECSAQLHNLANHMMGKSIGSNTDVLVVAVSRDGESIVVGATDGFTIWNRTPADRNLRKVEYHIIKGVRAIDISSDSKWVVTGSDARTADVWDVSTGKRHPTLGPLKHEYNVVLVKFCPCGKRIATATLFGSVRIYATNSGQKLLTIPVSVMTAPSIPNITFAWFPNRPQIFVASQGQIKCLNSDDGSIVIQWPLRGVSHPPSVALSPDSKFIAYSINDVVVVRDTVTRQQIGDALKLNGNVSCIAFSPGNDYLVVGADTKFTIWDLRKLFQKAAYTPDMTALPAESCTKHDQDPTKKSFPSTFSLPLMSIINGAVKPWLHGYLKYADEVLSGEIDSPNFLSHPNHDTLANRALVRGRQGDGNMALKDAEWSLSVQPSPIGHIAKTIALIHKNMYDVAQQEITKIEAFHLDKHKLLLKIMQSILFSLSGEYDKHIAHIITLDKDQKNQILLLLVQANMYLVKNDFEHAKEAVKKAHVPAIFPHDETPEMWSISFIFGWKFSGLAIQIQQKKCQSLLDDGNPQAVELYQEIKEIYVREIVLHIELSDWSKDFRKDCLERLEGLGDKALESGDYRKAIDQYTAVEHLISDLKPKYDLLLKRSRAHRELGPENWGKALEDAEEAIKLDKYSPWGYECQHAVLYAKQHYHEAAESLDELVKCLAHSKDARSTELRKQGVDPDKSKHMIFVVVNEVLEKPRPLLLINTKSGRLCNKQQQTEVFRADPGYKKLILSPVSQLDGDISWKGTIKQYFCYSTLSHTWEDNGEPEFRHMESKAVDDLDAKMIPNRKLQAFCKKTHEYGYFWAWSDTCCINKAEKEVLNMSLRSMYTWYSASSLTLVHLKGVLGQLDVDADTILEILDILTEFVKCRWNTRAWTLQEYFASRVIHFYTEDWKPYLPISHHSDTNPINHKTFTAIKQGMKLVTGLDADNLAALRPGIHNARQKLHLASTRKATRKEDMAYSLLGIFKVTIEAIYGDDEVPRALGRLLGALLTKSSDVTILAWTGQSSEYNTCLPAEITVYREDESLYIPRRVEATDLATSIPSMLSSVSPTDLDAAITLYDRLLRSPPPEILDGRLKLSCIWFPVRSISPGMNFQSYVATVPLLGEVDIETADELTNSRPMVLVHPWFKRLVNPSIPMEDSAKRESALKFLAALRQPFGALLLASNENFGDYERVAADKLISVQIREDVSPEKLLENIHLLFIR